MTALPTVTALVSAHNYGRYLGAALESVLGQTYPAELLDIVVVDDGSTDNTSEVAARYAALGVRYLHKPNGGLISTINAGLAQARGELIAFLSADDTWVPSKTMRQVEHLLAHPEVGLVHSDMEVTDGGGRVVHPSFLDHFGLPRHDGAILPLLLQRNVVSGGPTMVRASLVGECFPIDQRVAAWEDWWMAFHVAQVARIGLISEPLYRYRSHGQNMNLGSSGIKLQRIIRAEIPFRRYMITSLRHGMVTPGELLAGYSALVTVAQHAADALGEPITSVVTVGEDERAAAHARVVSAGLHKERGDTDRAAFDLVAALAHNPWDAVAASRINELRGDAR
jgi:glycosyltransferase involved in cell wall biosynthesis